MNQEEILKALHRLKAETGSPACLGCGHENSCSTRGCAVIRAVIEMLEQLQDHEPVTPEEAKRMDYAKVWIGYGEEGEWGIIVNGKLYATDTLEGAGFGELLEETVRGELLDNPTGDYKIYRTKLMKHGDQEKNEPCELCGSLGIEKSAQNILDRVQQKLGISAEQLMDLVQEYQEGRCVVVPKNYNGSLFQVEFGEIFSSDRYAGFMRKLGKKLFLTREAAEDYLKGEKQ